MKGLIFKIQTNVTVAVAVKVFEYKDIRMKVSKIPGLGRFGIFIDDLDFSKITDEEWLEVGQLHLKNLVTIIRNVDVSPLDYESRMHQWGFPRDLQSLKLVKKYNTSNFNQLINQEVINGIPVDAEDRDWWQSISRIMASEINEQTSVLRVSGKKNENGEPLGMFQEGELLWHSNESGQLAFTPGVSLLGKHGLVGSATGFVTTTDWYENQSESFRSELDEMIIQHEFTPGRINPGLHEEQDDIMYRNMCPAPSEIPLVIQSPAGIKGLHYSVNTINKIKGMTQEESQSIFDVINKGILTEENIYDHWYKQDNDLCLFDNSITLHRRLGGISDRLCYRIQHDYSKLTPQISPYFQEPFKSDHAKIINGYQEVQTLASN
jgi:alpha-ketoglutarate-dependent taurine dioxygenase